MFFKRSTVLDMSINQRNWQDVAEKAICNGNRYKIGTKSNIPYGPFHIHFSERFEEMKKFWIDSTQESRLHLLRVVTSRLNKNENAANEFRKWNNIDHFYVATCPGWKGLFDVQDAPYILYMKTGCDKEIVSSKGINIRNPNINDHWTKTGLCDDNSQFFKQHCKSFSDSRQTSDNGSVVSDSGKKSSKIPSNLEEVILDFSQRSSDSYRMRAEIFSAMSSMSQMSTSEVRHVISNIDDAIEHLDTLKKMALKEFFVENEEPESDIDSASSFVDDDGN